MFCYKCGTQLADNSVFCSACGTRVAGQPTQATAQAASTMPSTKEGWMLLAIQDAIAVTLKDPYSVKYGAFENIEIDAYGRTYAEIVVRAKNSYGAYVPTRYAVGFFDVRTDAPCTMIPKSLYVLPGIMVGAQRKVAKKMMKFGTSR